MHILLCGPSNKNTSRTVMGGDFFDRFMLTPPMDFRNLIGQVPTAVHQCVWGTLYACTSDTVENIAGAAAGQRTKVKSMMGYCVEIGDFPQLSTTSLCSVSEACWATVLFSWLRSFDTTSRNERLCTSLWRGSGKEKQESFTFCPHGTSPSTYLNVHKAEMLSLLMSRACSWDELRWYG